MLETQCTQHNASEETEGTQKANATLNTWATVHRKQTARAALPKTRGDSKSEGNTTTRLLTRAATLVRATPELPELLRRFRNRGCLKLV
eukprot:7906450-Alexandrium_andersonii.AAC.1